MANLDNEQVKQLIDKYLAGQCTPQEIETIESWYLSYSGDRPDQLDDTNYKLVKEQIWVSIKNRNQPVKYIRRRLLAAASVMLCIGVGAYFITKKQPAQQQFVAQTKPQDLKPGGNKAILTLANGKQIILTNAQNGVLASEGNTHISKTADGVVRYDNGNNKHTAAEVAYNAISTPRGGKYTVTLPDGTTATLDALSSIRFPTAFTGKTREVTTTGQVYFEVAHNAAQPFRVTTKGQTVEVLGTHFNIDAYDDESAIKTTLLQGSVRIVSNGRQALLKPGQQAQVKPSGSDITVIPDADVDEVLAWTKGFFQFNNDDIRTVMGQLSRWYDVDVTYKGEVPNRTFSGKIYRNVNASQILEIMNLSKVHFKIEGKKIIVTE